MTLLFLPIELAQVFKSIIFPSSKVHLFIVGKSAKKYSLILL